MIWRSHSMLSTKVMMSCQLWNESHPVLSMKVMKWKILSVLPIKSQYHVSFEMKEFFSIVQENMFLMSVMKRKSSPVSSIRSQYHVRYELKESYGVVHESHNTMSIMKMINHWVLSMKVTIPLQLWKERFFQLKS